MSVLARAFSYNNEGQPVMVIYKKIHPKTTFTMEKRQVEGYVIELNDAFMFSRDHYPAAVPVFYGFNSHGQPVTSVKVLTYDEAMFAKCEEFCIQFDLGVITSRKMAEIASMIEDGIDDLVGMAPKQERERHEIGEATIIDNSGQMPDKTVSI